MIAGNNNGNKETSNEKGAEENREWEAQVPAIPHEHKDALRPLAGSDNEDNALEPPRGMEKRVGKGVVEMLILAVPDILSIFREPKMDDGLIVDVDINIVPVGEAMVSVVLVAPPPGGKSEESRSHNEVQHSANGSSAVAEVVTKPSSLLETDADQE